MQLIQMMISFLVLASFVSAQPVPNVGAKTGTVSGRVLNEAKAGVGGSFVMLVSILGSQKSESPFRASARTTTVDPQGNFGFENVEPGHYRICAEASHVNYWNNCWWGEPTEVDVVAGGIVGPVAVNVGAAEKVRVRIKDPKKLREDAKKNKELVSFWASARAEKLLAVPFVVETDDGKEIVLVATAPVDREVKVKLSSGLGKFNDDDGPVGNPEKVSGEYTVRPGDAKSREIKVSLQSLDRTERSQ
jgi:hypothetical protein